MSSEGSVPGRDEFVDSIMLGAPDSILFWTPDQQLAGFRNFDRIYPTRHIPASEFPYPLPEHYRDLSQLRYEVAGEVFGFADFLEHNHVVGLLAIKDGQIVLEEYQSGNDRTTKWVSFSIAKSVVSLLIGAAVHDGFISSIDDRVSAYVPVLRGSSYDDVSIREAMQMASGVAWNEDYTDPDSDVSQEIGLRSLERLRYLGNLPRAAPAGTRFNYSTGETHLLGSVLRAAIGNNLSTYLYAKMWRPFGMEAPAHWMLVEPDGAEHGGCCLSATLRDYGRIGLFALRGGVLRDDTRVLPDSWMTLSTEPSPGNDGYGFLWWLGEGEVYNAFGIYGQAIAVRPSENLVIVTHSVWPQATGVEYSSHRAAFIYALMAALR